MKGEDYFTEFAIEILFAVIGERLSRRVWKVLVGAVRGCRKDRKAQRHSKAKDKV